MELESNSEERNWAMTCHLASFAGYVLPLGNIIGPLVAWLMKRDEFPLVDDQGKEALNFQISMTIYLNGRARGEPGGAVPLPHHHPIREVDPYRPAISSILAARMKSFS
jgi:hypothetical protein